MVSREVLDIKGYRGRNIRNSYYKQFTETEKVALVFPGLSYNTSMPLLHYSIEAILASGLNLLTVDYDYSTIPEFMEQPLRAKADWMIRDVEAALRIVTEVAEQEVACLVGKSLGTIAIGHILETYEEYRDAKTIWLTPLIKNPELMEQMLSYMKDAVLVIGTKDDQYDSDIIDRLNATTLLSGVVVEGANHSLEIEGDVTKTLRVLMQVVTIIQQFLM
ncbi:MAG: hypothetical protein ACFFF9_12855 [Candidatus Thorarchaeota archaeon]